jgi:hypothetical protein
MDERLFCAASPGLCATPHLRGVTRIQPGIESLSTNVLQLMNKGCTALQNVQRGFVDVRPREPYPYIFSLPEAELHELAYEFDFTYVEPRDAAAYTRELAAFIEQWRGQAPSARGELVRVVEGGRAALHDTRWNMEPAVYELSAAQDAMVVFCDAARPFERICQHMAQGFAWTRERVFEELEILCVRRLCLRDGEHYLSVALIGEPAYELAQVAE